MGTPLPAPSPPPLAPQPSRRSAAHPPRLPAGLQGALRLAVGEPASRPHRLGSCRPTCSCTRPCVRPSAHRPRQARDRGIRPPPPPSRRQQCPRVAARPCTRAPHRASLSGRGRLASRLRLGRADMGGGSDAGGGGEGARVVAVACGSSHSLVLIREWGQGKGRGDHLSCVRCSRVGVASCLARSSPRDAHDGAPQASPPSSPPHPLHPSPPHTQARPNRARSSRRSGAAKTGSWGTATPRSAPAPLPSSRSWAAPPPLSTAAPSTASQSPTSTSRSTAGVSAGAGERG